MKRVLPLLLLILLLAGCGKAPAQMGETSDLRTEKLPTAQVRIALLDTGVSTKAIDRDRLLNGYNYAMGNEDTEDQVNHGTAVASAILGCESAGVEGVAPTALVVPLVIVTKEGNSTISVSPETLARAIRDSVDVYHVNIINVSLGIREDNADLRSAVDYANRKGVLVIAAVGNDGATGKAYYPAAYDAVLAVGSCNKAGEESGFSQPGADVLAPGEGFTLASRNGVAYGVKGTSYASGFVSGYAARLLADRPYLSPEELTQHILAGIDTVGGCLPTEME